MLVRCDLGCNDFEELVSVSVCTQIEANTCWLQLCLYYIHMDVILVQFHTLRAIAFQLLHVHMFCMA